MITTRWRNVVVMQCSPLEPSVVASTEWAITMVANDSEAVHHDLDKEKGLSCYGRLIFDFLSFFD